MYIFVRLFFFCIVIAGLSSCNNDRNAIVIGDHKFTADYAITDAEKEKGLMFVEEIDPGYAMVFFNSTPLYTKFWMKNTLIPLDMLFFDQNNTLIHIEHSAVPHDLSHRGPDVPVCIVVEIKGGQAKERNIQLGDKIIHNTQQECLH